MAHSLHPTPRELERDLRKLKELLASRGWAVMREAMERDILTAAMAIANDPRMPLDEINFRRGAIWAGRQLLDMPAALAARLQATIALSAQPNDATPAHPLAAETWPEWKDADDTAPTAH